MKISGTYPNRPGEPRCIELSIMLKSELAAPEYPARSEFLYGEWLRGHIEKGAVPEPLSDPGVTLMLAQARQEAVPVVGPDLSDLLSEIPADQVRRAMCDALPSLVGSLHGDERNVLLTLARMWRTAETGEFVTKDAAVDWAIPRLPPEIGHLLEYARAAYLGSVTDDWKSRGAESQRTLDYLHTKVLALL
jgi:hypothetical protein